MNALTRDQARRWAMMEQIDACLLVTVTARGPHARPAEGAIWFLTDATSHKTEELETSPDVCVIFTDGSFRHLVVLGHATLINDRDAASSVWSPGARAFWPEGPDDASVPGGSARRVSSRSCAWRFAPDEGNPCRWEHLKPRLVLPGEMPWIGEEAIERDQHRDAGHQRQQNAEAVVMVETLVEPAAMLLFVVGAVWPGALGVGLDGEQSRKSRCEKKRAVREGVLPFKTVPGDPSRGGCVQPASQRKNVALPPCFRAWPMGEVATSQPTRRLTGRQPGRQCRAQY